VSGLDQLERDAEGLSVPGELPVGGDEAMPADAGGGEVERVG
jgi:hypothetical protein